MATPPAPSSAAPPDLLTHLSTLAASLSSTHTSLPSTSDSALISAPRNGISLLDVKNDVLLSYLQHLVFLSLLRLRSAPLQGSPAVDALVKLRLLLERAVRPLEMKLKYQIDKVVVAAGRGERGEGEGEDGEEEGGEESDSGDESAGSEDEGAGRKALLATAAATAPADLAHRPNPSSLLRAGGKAGAAADDEKAADGVGVYRPPRIAATSMPTTVGREKKAERLPRAHLLDDFVTDELSTAPLAQPSIGTTIVDGGRGGHKSARDKRVEHERQEFEEANLVRLPKPSKKEARAGRQKGMLAAADKFGGEDWRGFAGDLDRITARVGRSGRGEKALDKSRKRQSGEGEGKNIGEHYEGRKGMAAKRRKM
ncbi:hypothetical protein BZA05DRAFT_115142 [Tricharina praecox]|uniref:uncharacterized protein n=1 Tax=Tricharina praecox TaxID=43433 RepID=UPI00221FEFD7|nr:uncharacterized protein BZA05DRAFT_115142 [Tricharina praecox]KAI5858087.1 hypothetical protein BZA05DRAFT_115142 [Tricharina praecox]